MSTFRVVLLSSLATAAVASLAYSAAAQHSYTLSPPQVIGERLDQLRKHENRTAAISSLASRDDAAPYLRNELRTASDMFYILDLSEALRVIESRAFERNKKRFAWWAMGHRFDLCTELLVVCPSNSSALDLADVAHLELHLVAIEAARALDLPATSVSGPNAQIGRKPQARMLLVKKGAVGAPGRTDQIPTGKRAVHIHVRTMGR